MTTARVATLAAACLLVVPTVARAQDLGLGEGWRWSEFGSGGGLPAGEIIDFVETRAGTQWMSTAGGTAWFDGYSWQGVLPGLPSVRPTALAMGPGEDEVLVVLERRLYVGSSAAGFRHIPVALEGVALNVDDAVVDDAGRIIVAVQDGLLVVDDGVAPFRAPGAYPNGAGNRLDRTRSGAVFFHGTDAVHRWRDGAWSLVLPASTSFLQVPAIREIQG